MEPFEIMISESQERMLCVVAAKLDKVLAVCGRWEVNATAIGKVTGTGQLRVFDGEALVGDLPVSALVDECPAYDLEPLQPATPIYAPPERELDEGLDAAGTLLALLGSANLASRRWAFEQYDCVVGSRTVCRPEQADAAVSPCSSPAARSPCRSTATDAASRFDPYRGRSSGARVLGQPCLRRRRAARAHRLPELRQPREAPHRVAAHARGGRARRRLPGARGAGRGRQRARSTTRAARARSTRRRSSAWSASCPTPVRAGRLGFADPGDAVALIGLRGAVRIGSELAKLRGDALEGYLPGADLGALQARTPP